MKELKLCVEYGAPPFFDAYPETMGHVDLHDFNFPKKLFDDIFEWDQDFQKTFSEGYPPDSGFSSPEQTALHNERGAILAKEIEAALGKNVSIEFLPLNH